MIRKQQPYGLLKMTGHLVSMPRHNVNLCKFERIILRARFWIPSKASDRYFGRFAYTADRPFHLTDHFFYLPVQSDYYTAVLQLPRFPYPLHQQSHFRLKNLHIFVTLVLFWTVSFSALVRVYCVPLGQEVLSTPQQATWLKLTHKKQDSSFTYTTSAELSQLVQNLVCVPYCYLYTSKQNVFQAKIW